MKKTSLLALLAMSSSAFGATVTGTLKVNNQPLTGYVAFQLAYPGITSDHLNLPVQGQQIPVKNGTFPAQTLDGNDVMQPKGTFYLVTYLDAFHKPILRAPYVITGATYDLGAAVPTPITTANVSYLDLLGLRNLSVQNLSVTNLQFPGGTTINAQGVTNASTINGIAFAAGFQSGSSTCGIQEAYNSLPSTGGWIVVPQGLCTLTAAVQINKYPVQLTGYGTGAVADTVNYSTYFGGSMLKNGSTSADMFDISVNSGVPVLGGISFNNLMLIGNSTIGGATQGANVNITGGKTAASLIQDVFFNNVFSGYSVSAALFLKDNVFNVRLNNSELSYNTGYGLYATDSGTSLSTEGPRSIVVSQSNISNNTLDGIQANGPLVEDISVIDSYVLRGLANGINVTRGSVKASIHAVRDKIFANTNAQLLLSDGYGHQVDSSQLYYFGRQTTPQNYGIYFDPPSGTSATTEQLRIQESELDGSTIDDLYIGANASRVIIYPNLFGSYTSNILNTAAVSYVQLGNSQGSFQTAKMTTGLCTTGNDSYDSCAVTLPWSNPFPDTNYSVTCTGIGPSDPRANTTISSYNTTGVTVNIVTYGSVGVTFNEIDCLGKR